MPRKKTIWFILLCAIIHRGLISCIGEKKADYPENILNEEKFTDLLVSFALAESASNMNVLSVPSYRMDTVYAFNPLLEHNIRRTQYDSTVKFYVEHPEIYKRVYEKVLTVLTEMQTRKDSVSTAKK